MEKILNILIILALLYMLILCSFSKNNLNYIKDHAEKRWKSYGCEIIGYGGYERGFSYINTYGGAKVWYRLRNIKDNGVTYIGYLQRWGDEIHIYNVKALDAINLSDYMIDKRIL